MSNNTSKKRTGRFILPIILALLAVASASYVIYDRVTDYTRNDEPTTAVNGNNSNLSQTSPQNDFDPVEITMSASAEQILKDYDKNRSSGDEKYKDKGVEFSGKITALGQKTIVFQSDDKNKNVKIWARIRSNQDITTVKVGDSVIISGKCTGVDSAGCVIFVNCTIETPDSTNLPH